MRPLKRLTGSETSSRMEIADGLISEPNESPYRSRVIPVSYPSLMTENNLESFGATNFHPTPILGVDLNPIPIGIFFAPYYYHHQYTL